MCLLHVLMAELSVKTNIVKVLLCDLVNNRLTPPGGKNNKYTYCYNKRCAFFTQRMKAAFEYAKKSRLAENDKKMSPLREDFEYPEDLPPQYKSEVTLEDESR